MSFAAKKDLVARELAESLALNRGLFEDFDVEWQDERGRSLLHHAVLRGDTDLVRDMLIGGANVMVEDRIGATPLHMAVLVPNRKAIIDMLLSEGAKPDIQKCDGLSPLHEACWVGNVEGVRSLLAHNANLDLLDGFGRAPEDVARQYEKDDVVLALQEERRRRVSAEMFEVRKKVDVEWEDVIKSKVRKPIGLPGQPRHPRDEEVKRMDGPMKAEAPHSPVRGETTRETKFQRDQKMKRLAEGPPQPSYPGSPLRDRALRKGK